MIFLNAFILGGALCLLFQILLMFTKLDVTRLLVIGLFGGAIITVFGISDLLVEWGGAGFSIMAIGAAQGVYYAFMALFTGDFIPILIVLSIFSALIVLGLIAGAVRKTLESSKKAIPSETKKA